MMVNQLHNHVHKNSGSIFLTLLISTPSKARWLIKQVPYPVHSDSN